MCYTITIYEDRLGEKHMSENTQDTMNDKAIEALEDAKNVQMNEQIEKQNEEINKQYEELETHTSKQYDASNIRV